MIGSGQLIDRQLIFTRQLALPFDTPRATVVIGDTVAGHGAVRNTTGVYRVEPEAFELFIHAAFHRQIHEAIFIIPNRTVFNIIDLLINKYAGQYQAYRESKLNDDQHLSRAYSGPCRNQLAFKYFNRLER